VGEDPGTCGEGWTTHRWAWDAGRLVCSRCGLPDLTSARLPRDAVTAARDAGLIRPLDDAGDDDAEPPTLGPRRRGRG
jgi:hypothetical protein